MVLIFLLYLGDNLIDKSVNSDVRECCYFFSRISALPVTKDHQLSSYNFIFYVFITASDAEMVSSHHERL